ncbi:hypothetical protein BsWGS_23772 [Bradybaena similaris]
MFRFVLIALTIQCVFSRCQDGWTLNKGFCYGFSADFLTWNDAAAMCLVYGARLVQIDSLEKNNWLASEMAARQMVNIWVGGSCRFHTNLWVWVPSYKQMKPFTNWYPGQPDNPLGEQCIEIHQGRQYKWNDLACGYALRYICEKSVTASSASLPEK